MEQGEGVPLAGPVRMRVNNITVAAVASASRLEQVAFGLGDVFGPLGETLFWITALDTPLRKERKAQGGTYDAYPSLDVARRAISGLLHARNEVAHGVTLTVLYKLDLASYGSMAHGSSAYGGGGDHRWLSRTVLPRRRQGGSSPGSANMSEPTMITFPVARWFQR
jgi:hypothetical protein